MVEKEKNEAHRTSVGRELRRATTTQKLGVGDQRHSFRTGEGLSPRHRRWCGATNRWPTTRAMSQVPTITSLRRET